MTSSMSSEEVDRLFVPLAAGPFSWFQSGKKTWELRRCGRQYTDKNIRLGRRVELRMGYTDPGRALWGVIVNIEQAATVSEFFKKVPYELVIPVATSLAEAVTLTSSILGLQPDNCGPVLGFEVDLE